MGKKFETGGLYFTRGVNDLIAEDIRFSKFVLNSIRRHFSGDWGEMTEADKQENEQAVADGRLRIFSAYETKELRKIWIITEADRSATTVLFPEEY